MATQYREACHCGHDRATHFTLPGCPITGDCLSAGCDCESFVNANDPRPARQPKYDIRSTYLLPKRRPHEDKACRCNACLYHDYGY